ncbi:hypothetical protein JT170_01025 [Helicobacter pylori]|nr:hypothetical protein [Helicobacter pylori]
MKKMNGYQKLKAELKEKEQTIAELKRELDKAKDQTIESKNETIDALKRESDVKDQLIESLTERRYRDERKEYSKSCLGFE